MFTVTSPFVCVNMAGLGKARVEVSINEKIKVSEQNPGLDIVNGFRNKVSGAPD